MNLHVLSSLLLLGWKLYDYEVRVLRISSRSIRLRLSKKISKVGEFLLGVTIFLIFMISMELLGSSWK